MAREQIMYNWTWMKELHKPSLDLSDREAVHLSRFDAYVT